ncbi:MAG: hypothetical protein F4X66_00595 [Chloroflexi bacterium]|nr:hypothetical protein [Chloroflexota bacterium]MYE40973.1 hypothetical protein [Chloroflexota bacterium]
MTVKEEVLELMEKLPDDATIEDAIERLIVLYRIQQGLEQLDKWEGIPQEEAKKRIRQWLK